MLLVLGGFETVDDEAIVCEFIKDIPFVVDEAATVLRNDATIISLPYIDLCMTFRARSRFFWSFTFHTSPNAPWPISI